MTSSKKKWSDSFIMFDRALITSPSWKCMSINCKKLIDFLCEEHLSKGGRENGKLMATYNQLVKAGISRRIISRTILEAESLGLVRVERGGRKGCTNHESIFMVTFLPLFNGEFKAPVHDWRTVNQSQIHNFQANLKIKSWLRSDADTVPPNDASQFH